MAYTDDWESLMNGVFGAGGRVKFGSGAAQPDTKAKTGGLPDLNAALLEQQKQLDELLKKQNAQLKKQDADTQTALENSRQMLRDMENDGLLAKGTADTKPEHLGSFEGLATEVKKTVLGHAKLRFATTWILKTNLFEIVIYISFVNECLLIHCIVIHL